MGYSFQLAARVLLYTTSHRQDNIYHGLCCTSRGALAGTEIAEWVHHEGSIRRPIAPWATSRSMDDGTKIRSTSTRQTKRRNRSTRSLHPGNAFAKPLPSRKSKNNGVPWTGWSKIHWGWGGGGGGGGFSVAEGHQRHLMERVGKVSYIYRFFSFFFFFFFLGGGP